MSFPLGAVAQDSEEERTAAARALFEEGMRHVAEGRVEEAADRLRRSLALRHSAVVAFNLSTALLELGALVEASEHLRAIVRDDDAAAPVRQAAEARLAELLGRIAHLELRLDGPRARVEVTLDGSPLAPELIGVARPIDPGAHVVTASRDRQEVARESIDLEEGERAALVLSIPPLPPLEEAIEASIRQTSPPSSELDVPAIVLGTSLGAVALGAVIAIVVAVVASEPAVVSGDFEPPIVRVGG